MVNLSKEEQNLNLPRAQEPRETKQRRQETLPTRLVLVKHTELIKKKSLWSDVDTYAEVHSLLPATAREQGFYRGNMSRQTILTGRNIEKGQRVDGISSTMS